MEIREIVRTLEVVANRYGLNIIFIDFTDVTLVSRIGFLQNVFIQIYVNVKKDKVNMALIVVGNRIYGVDKEGGAYHEHPFEDPLQHIDTDKMDIEDFIIKSLEILKKIKLI